MRPMVLLLAKTLLVPLASAAPLSLFRRQGASALAEDDDDPKSAADPDLYLYLGIAVSLVLLGGVFAGLTIALMGQDETYLQVIATSGEGSEKKHATKVLKLLNKGKHWVLVTLLLSNVITNETLPIVLDRSLGGGWPAVLSSTILIVIFGEIAPQSVCVRYGLSIGAFMAPPMLVLMWIMCPVAWPTAKLLDWLLGEDHGTMYKKAGLKTLVQLHKTLGTTPGERLMEDEVTIINSVLDLKEKPVGDIMTPMQDVFIMSADTVLDEPMMDTILSQGYSRIPIYAPDNQRNFIGMLLVKILITYDPEDGKRVRDFALATLPETLPDTSCLDIINFFQEGKSHMVLVSDYPGDDKGALGVVTLEDVIEELIGEEIIDESDVFVDVHKAIRRMAPAPHQRYGKRPSMDPIITYEPEREAGEDEPLLSNGNGDEQKLSQPNVNGIPSSTVLVRRKSSTASDGGRGYSPRPGLYPVRTSTQEMREHLRHLGPSNAASKPRQTKYTSVKIKPGVGTIPENQTTTKGIDDIDVSQQQQQQHQRSLGENERPSSTPRRVTADGSERDGDGLLRSAGRDASDGATALLAGYGSIGADPPRIRGISADYSRQEPSMSAGEASKVAEQKAQTPNASPETKGKDGSRLKVPEKVVIGSGDGDGEEGDQVGELGVAPGRERSKSRRGVRSGSITETEVEIGGMKKVVLEANSSSDTEEDGNAKSGAASLAGVEGESEDEAAGGTNGRGSDAGQTGSGAKKKRKHRGKRKKGNGGS